MTAGKVYFVTGANQGIGFELVKQLAKDSSNTVIGSYRDESRSQDLIALSKSSSNVKIVKLEVSDQSSIDKLPSQLSEVASDGIDVFISNAGIFQESAFYKVLETERSSWLNHFEVNTVGPVFILKAILPFLEKKSTKQVILISSLVGSITNKLNLENTAYGVSKVALNFIGLSLSAELEDYTVVPIHPGLVGTDSANAITKALFLRKPELEAQFEAFPVITAEESAAGIIKVVGKVDNSYDGKFYNYDGTPLQW